MKVIGDILNAEPVSTAYMPVKNKFGDLGKDENTAYMLDGIILEDEGIIKRLDKNLLSQSKSNVVYVEYKKDGELSERSKKYILSKSQFVQIQKYCFDVIEKATQEMLDGYITPKPYQKGNDNPCQYCEYKAMCHYSINKDGYRVIDKKAKNSFGEKE